MAVMVLFRMLEIKLHRDIISRNFREAVDDLILDIWKITFGWIVKNKNIIFHELKKIPIFVLHWMIGFWGFALRKTLKAVNLIQGKHDSTAKGYVIEHLKAVDSYKKQLILKERE